VLTRNWPLCRLEAARRYTLFAHAAERHRRAVGIVSRFQSQLALQLIAVLDQECLALV
jgi:hypothetical protein